MGPEDASSVDRTDSFVRDLAASLRAWAKDPRLPLVTLLLLVVPILTPRDGIWAVVSFAISLFWLGWVGTERIWYLRIFRDLPFELGEGWPLTRAFIGRFLLLGCLAAACYVPVLLATLLVTSLIGQGADVSRDTVATWSLLAFVAVADVALTFVTPALAYRTTRVFSAVSEGLSTIRDAWPSSAPYVLVPALTLVVTSRVLATRSTDPLVSVILAVIGGLLTLAMKGATARFYLRRHVVGANGAAYTRDAPPPPPAEPTPPAT
jgi:hypothetical protein